MFMTVAAREFSVFEEERKGRNRRKERSTCQRKGVTQS